MNIAKTRRAAMAVAAASLLLTACRVPFSAEAKFVEQGPRAIAGAGFETMRELTSVRILGRGEFEDGRAKFDVRIDDRDNCTGTFDFDHGSIQTRKTENGFWAKVDANYWRESSSPQVAARAIEVVGTKWMTRFMKAADLEKLCDFDKFLADFKLEEKDTDDRLLKGEVEKVGDIEAIPIDENRGKDRSTVWISVSAPHRVIKVAPTDDPNGLNAAFFDDFNAELVVDTPAKDDVVDVAKLGQ